MAIQLATSLKKRKAVLFKFSYSVQNNDVKQLSEDAEPPLVNTNSDKTWTDVSRLSIINEFDKYYIMDKFIAQLLIEEMVKDNEFTKYDHMVVSLLVRELEVTSDPLLSCEYHL